MTETRILTFKTVVVVTVTATDPAATTASDGGVVVVYVTETASTTDQSGRPTNVMVVRFPFLPVFQQVPIRFVQC